VGTVRELYRTYESERTKKDLNGASSFYGWFRLAFPLALLTVPMLKSNIGVDKILPFQITLDHILQDSAMKYRFQAYQT
jgi:hypothetical protein